MPKKTLILLFVCWLCLLSTLTLQAQKKSRLTYAQEQLAQFDYYFYDAVSCMHVGQIDKAMMQFRFCLQICPDNAAANASLGAIYEALNWLEALKCYEQAVQSEPRNWEYRRKYVEALIKANEIKKALIVAEAGTRLNPKNDDVYNVLAVVYKMDEQYAKSIKSLDKLEKLVGLDEYISLEKFRLYLKLHKFKKGIDEVEKLIAEYPEDYRYKVFRGDIFMEQNMPEKAFEMYQQVIAEDPENPYVYLSLAEYYKAKNAPEQALSAIVDALENNQLDLQTKLNILGQYAESLMAEKESMEGFATLLKTLVELYPLEEQVHGFYAAYLLRINQLQEAERTLYTMLDINPKNEGTWSQLLEMALQSQNNDKILDVSTRAIAELPQYAIWYFYKAIVEYIKGNEAEALQDNLKGLSYVVTGQEDLKSRFLSQIGDLYFKQGKKEEAFAAYEEAIRINANDVSVLNNYAYYLSLENANLKKAERMSARTVELDPANPVYLDTYAWIFYMQGNYSLAKLYIERAIDNLPEAMQDDDPEIWEHYGFILHRTGNEEKAIVALQKAIACGSTNQEAKELLNHYLNANEL